MTERDHEDRLLLLHAALDNELDAAGVIEVERLLASDPELSAEYARLKALRESIRRHAAREAAPQSLKTRILASIENESARDSQRVAPGLVRGPPGWRSLAAAVAATFVATLGLQHLIVSAYAPDPTLQAIVASHMRSQISGQPIDIASSDRHTVKPWLSSKLPVASIVVDLSGEGFPLLGGRIDIVDGIAAPTLVYKRREHLISVTELPANRFGGASAPRRLTLQGFPAIQWSDRDRSYVVVSDLAPAELDSFVAVFRDAISKETRGSSG